MKNDMTKVTNTWLVWSSFYVLILLIIMSYLNYVMPYSAEATITPGLWNMFLWGLLYLPIVALPLVAKRNVSDFGFTLSPQLALVCILVSMLCASFSNLAETSWVGASVEAFARTGEEIFFRGFLFDLCLQLFSNRRRSWLWAALASSVLFASIHTQTFQPAVLSQYGYPAIPAIFVILQRLVNVFGLALVFALVRVATHSILPGAIVHSMGYGGILAIPFVVIFYFLAVLWAYKRGEKILIGIPAQAG